MWRVSLTLDKPASYTLGLGLKVLAINAGMIPSNWPHPNQNH